MREISHQGNANLDFNRTPLHHQQQWIQFFKGRITSGGKNEEKLIPYLWDYKTVQPLGNMVWQFLKKVNRDYHMTHNSTPGLIPKITENRDSDNSTTMFTAVLFTTQ